MLKIFFGDNPGDNYIFNPDVFFNNTYEDEWITSETSRKMIKDIDGSEVKGPCMIDSPFPKRYPLCENRRIPFTRSPPVSCLLGRCPNPRRTQKLCSGTMDKSIGCAIFQIACGRAAQRCSASFSRRSFASSCSLSSSRIRSILALAVSSSFISSRALR